MTPISMTPISLGEASTPDNTRIYAIGDIHGYLDLIKQLHQMIRDDLATRPIENHKIIHIGDYIDRGPKSADCLQYLSDLSKSDPNVICLKGNHEAKLVNFLNDPIQYSNSFLTYGGAECALSYGVKPVDISVSNEQMLEFRDELATKIPAEHIDFINQLPLSYILGDYMFVHAGIRAGIALDQQADSDLMSIRTDFISCHDLYPKVIVHGHTPHNPIEIKPNRINVDTCAYNTGQLTAIVLEGKNHRILAT